MEQSPSWEADSHAASQEMLRLLWNPKAHYRAHKSPPLVSILSRIRPVHHYPPYVLEIRSNIILPSTPSSSGWFLPSGFPAKILEEQLSAQLPSNGYRGLFQRGKAFGA